MKRTIMACVVALGVSGIVSASDDFFGSGQWKSDETLVALYNDVFAKVSADLNFDAQYTEATKEVNAQFEAAKLAAANALGIKDPHGTEAQKSEEFQAKLQELNAIWFPQINAAGYQVTENFNKQLEVAFIEAMKKLKSNAEAMK